ncbi:hypothetical protein VV11_006045 [Trichodesmium erythraeum 21-75]|nr:hypothetical protein [Trichodesmium erythraeum 21-75]
MVRHLKRLMVGIDEALQTENLSANALGLLQPYQPNVSVTWLFQRSMSIGVNQFVEPHQINELLAGVFQVMEKLGEPVLKPFLQDVVQFPALAQTLFVTSLKQPGLVIKIIPQVGIGNLLNWMKHYLNLGVYSFLYPIGGVMEGLTAKMSEEQRYYYNRWIEQWKYGSGGDYIE